MKILPRCFVPAIVTGWLGFAGAAYAATEADVLKSFSPYSAGMPSFPGLTSGM
jgi:hypothetical protein